MHIIGPQATELIAEAVAAMELEATVEDLMWTIHAHPTLAEAMLDASNGVYGMPINARCVDLRIRKADWLQIGNGENSL